MNSTGSDFKLGVLLCDGDNYKIFHAAHATEDVVIKITDEQQRLACEKKANSSLISCLERKWQQMTLSQVPLSEENLISSLGKEKAAEHFLIPRDCFQV